MKILVLSRRSRSYSTERLVQAARGRGHTCQAVDPEECSLVLEGGRPVIYYKSRRLLNIALSVPRLGSQATEFSLSMLQALEELGVRCLNGPDSISNARDKFRSLRVLGRAGLPTPRTLLCRRPEEIGRKVQLIGGPPVLIKVVQGGQGPGAIVAENMDSIVSIVESFWEAGRNILLQQVMGRGREVRAFVVGGRVIAAVRRAPLAARSRGVQYQRQARVGPGEPAELTRQYRALAIQAAQALGLTVAGVDLHEGKGGPVVMEVNAAPGLEEVERATGIDVAGEVLRFAEAFVAEPAGAERELILRPR
jgi:ribosomal protein S6--L-glutamate ligase